MLAEQFDVVTRVSSLVQRGQLAFPQLGNGGLVSLTGTLLESLFASVRLFGGLCHVDSHSSGGSGCGIRRARRALHRAMIAAYAAVLRDGGLAPASAARASASTRSMVASNSWRCWC